MNTKTYTPKTYNHKTDYTRICPFTFFLVLDEYLEIRPKSGQIVSKVPNPYGKNSQYQTPYNGAADKTGNDLVIIVDGRPWVKIKSNADNTIAPMWYLASDIMWTYCQLQGNSKAVFPPFDMLRFVDGNKQHIFQKNMYLPTNEMLEVDYQILQEKYLDMFYIENSALMWKQYKKPAGKHNKTLGKHIVKIKHIEHDVQEVMYIMDNGSMPPWL